MRVAGGVLCVVMALSAPVVAAERGLTMPIADVVERFNVQSKAHGWETRLVQESCSKDNGQTACNYYVSDGLIAIATALDDDKTLRNISIFYTTNGDRSEMIRCVATMIRVFDPSIDDSETKAVISALFRGVAGSTSDEAKADLRGIRIRAMIPGKLGLFTVVFDRP